jgi:hypothetical protein
LFTYKVIKKSDKIKEQKKARLEKLEQRIKSKVTITILVVHPVWWILSGILAISEPKLLTYR